jgi:Ca-activated chloride channel family protein
MANQHNLNDSKDQSNGVASFAVATDRPLGRAGSRSVRYLKVDLDAVTVPARTERLPVQVAFALDRSGSMGGEKMSLAREAVIAAVRRLQATDRFAVTVFDNTVDVVEARTLATPTAVERARVALNRVDARGSTALHDGWVAACRQIGDRADAEGVARCILVTDGQANIGPSDSGVLAELARRQRLAGVATSTLGIGEDFQEELLAAMSKAGGGQFYYVQRADQLDRILQSEIGEAMEVCARGVAVELWPSAGVRLELLSDYPSTWTGTHLHVEVGDLVSAQHLELLVSARLASGQVGDEASVEVRVSDREGPLALPLQTARWQIADHTANDRQPRDFEVLRGVAKVIAARALLSVLGYNRRGSFHDVHARLDEAIRQLRVLGANDPEIASDIQQLERHRVELSHRIAEQSLKAHHMVGTSMSRSKSMDGSSVRRPKDVN